MPHDTTPPALTGLTLSSNTLDATAGPAPLTVTVTATDDLSGVLQIVARFSNAPSGQNVASAATVQPPSTAPGPTTISLTWPQYSAGGTWALELDLQDAAGNSNAFGPGTLAAMSLPSGVTLA